ncbi:hypothetical protein Tco_0575943 [Tanacetum coccineum]
MSFLTSIYSLGNIMDEVDIEDLTIEQYLRLTQESEAPKKVEDMTIAEYLEYEGKIKENHCNNTKSYLPTYFVMSEQEESDHEYAQSTQHFEDEEDVDEWLNAEIKSTWEMRDGIKKSQFEASTVNVSDEVSFITSNDIANEDKNTSNTAPCLLPKELSPRSFLLPFNIDNHNFYAATTLDAKDNIMPQRVYEYLGLDKLKGPVSLSPDRKGLVKRWHVCKPIHVTYDDKSGEDCGMWPTCDPDLKFYFGYDEVFRVNEHGTLRQWICFHDHERRAVKGSHMGFADCWEKQVNRSTYC